MEVRAKGPKCESCGKKIQLMSYDAAYIKVVKSGEARARFICWSCAEKLLGEGLKRIAGG